ncbi:T6SS immunity protein Tdi1 domain-containing protein [Clostridium sporogenes]|uniref:T6SS immunity protein Tdi1 domain-containing protein n=1 Tax=Clostridium sporogenes TaxID=1509 RepID=UPI001F1BA346|nr:T6SS immunity protein Tdi1 domain-containing protein [Clostridium sporogenes]MCF4016779.1 DUF1851 domain-containing protein [Clostridium sporogenes]
MDSSIFKEYKVKSKVDKNIFNKYKETLPLELTDVWKEYGFGSMLNGYLKIVNPDEYQSVVDMSYFRANVSIPILVTAFGDIITWEENKYIRLLRYKIRTFKGIASGFEFFWEDVSTGYFCEEFFELDKYNEAIEKYGELEYDECFGYVPLLGLGGSEKVENLRKVKIREHIELITQLVGKIE